MNVQVDVQSACGDEPVPDEDDLRRWITAAVHAQGRSDPAEVSVRLVDSAEMAKLNQTYRGRSGPTNVLSFAWEPPPGIPSAHHALGDLVLCAPVVEEEARRQRKSLLSHYAHMVIHGTLHLQGYDHQNADQAERMETLETQILGSLGFSDPYHVSCTNARAKS